MKKVNMQKLEAILNGLWNNEIKTYVKFYRLSVELANGNSSDIDRRVKSYGKIADNKKKFAKDPEVFRKELKTFGLKPEDFLL